MKLSQNIAGVTFLAFGNGAPDVFSAIAAVGNSKNGDSGLAFGALFGAGVFVSTVCVGIICFIQPFYSVQRPLLRDIICKNNIILFKTNQFKSILKGLV